MTQDHHAGNKGRTAEATGGASYISRSHVTPQLLWSRGTPLLNKVAWFLGKFFTLKKLRLS